MPEPTAANEASPLGLSVLSSAHCARRGWGCSTCLITRVSLLYLWDSSEAMQQRTECM